MKKEFEKRVGLIFSFIVIALLLFIMIVLMILFNEVTHLNKIIQILNDLDSIERRMQ